MRIVLVTLAAMTLSACNVVMSREALFTKADEDRAAPLKDGLWIQTDKDDGDCALDPAKPAAEWPECAEPQIIQGGLMVDPSKPAAPEPFVLAAGDPRVLQVKIDDKGLRAFLYGAVKPVRRDAQGRVVEARTWITLCGEPPPEPKDAKGPGDYLTKTPLAGLKPDVDTGSCWASDAASVRAAAKASEAWDKDRSVIRWVREARLDDLKPKAE
jgi:hypothetical protein